MTRQPLSSNFREVQYQIIASRRQAYDNLIWQTPVISLTAQAFLFQIALNKDSPHSAVIVSALLAFIAAIASLQLMAKHRHHETKDSKWLEDFETENPGQGIGIVHARPPTSPFWFLRISSYRLWFGALACFALASVFVLGNDMVKYKQHSAKAVSLEDKVTLLQSQNEALGNRLATLQKEFNERLVLPSEMATPKNDSSSHNTQPKKTQPINKPDRKQPRS